ncbi:hypothetical protein A2348_00705 [Candidatus Uhrbacteria bacterium RIFOXYB12_FULL_58_10]|uniref:Uncharacterized protein n=1 Tax=Candidatus Uhrbacteria bacterium RIFOXYB2_FULL_57_15 TaxID=1802422 RepID=A0A1F7W936_9BACT|nr:MAG: hypothetical protein A2348_00705 [Candidatus Uhrbacteria bacterium RIFOXYB12_FULL_58_10]OGL99279.1 MAG: hypothetical protein A2304_04625 [Candidatus Uhrbacteria bacterium RIFOXYB2_FULL_57_15]OGL99932.1 MAG: hypothetical protein A2501_04905 [Candidatus Uhrbacteria bacterium RIFOXYC12_FULL_57_11]
MSFDLRPLFSPSYWLTFDPPAVWAGAGRSLLVIFVGMIVASVVVRRVKIPRATDRHQATIYRKVVNLLFTMGFVGIILFFFSFQEIRLFGARFLYLLWIAGTVWWIVSIVRYAKKQVPEARRREIERFELEKYLPKKKK